MIIVEGKYYLYRHIRLDKNQPFYVGIGTKEFYKESTYYFRAFEYISKDKETLIVDHHNKNTN